VIPPPLSVRGFPPFVLSASHPQDLSETPIDQVVVDPFPPPLPLSTEAVHYTRKSFFPCGTEIFLSARHSGSGSPPFFPPPTRNIQSPLLLPPFSHPSRRSLLPPPLCVTKKPGPPAGDSFRWIFSPPSPLRLHSFFLPMSIDRPPLSFTGGSPLVLCRRDIPFPTERCLSPTVNGFFPLL